jgi:hypothetical protein
VGNYVKSLRELALQTHVVTEDNVLIPKPMQVEVSTLMVTNAAAQVDILAPIAM